MGTYLIVSDVHLGVQRSAGTTPKSAAELRAYLQGALWDLMMQHIDKDIIVNGDLFDDSNVPMNDVLSFYSTASAWLDASERHVWLGAGNHDLMKDSSRLSSFEFVAKILQMRYPAQVTIVQEPTAITRSIYMIPHLANQDLLDLALKQIPEWANHVFLHANYHNGFAAVSDHSLNVSEVQALELKAKGHGLIFGHEHQARQALQAYVTCTGNQWPSSIADCLRNPGGAKYAHVLYGGSLTPIQTWDGAEDFAQIEWHLLASTITAARFIRVTGEAKAEQAGDVIAAISKYRQKSDAYVVSNAVAIEGVQDMQDLPSSIEITKAFDVMAYLMEQLSPEQGATVKRLLDEQKETA